MESYKIGGFIREMSEEANLFGRGGKRFITIPLFKSLERVDEVGLIVRERFYVRRE